MTGQFQLYTQDRPHVVLELTGELEISSIHAFHETLQARDDEWNDRDIEVQVCELRYLDAAWLQVLLTLQKSVSSSGHSFVIHGVTPEVRELLDRSGDAVYLLGDDALQLADANA